MQKTSKTIKPIKNTPTDYHRFQVIIKDDYDTYSYTMKLPDTSSYDIVETICKHYGVDSPIGEWIGDGFRRTPTVE